jgi:hypothetical protein
MWWRRAGVHQIFCDETQADPAVHAGDATVATAAQFVATFERTDATLYSRHVSVVYGGISVDVSCVRRADFESAAAASPRLRLRRFDTQ